MMSYSAGILRDTWLSTAAEMAEPSTTEPEDLAAARGRAAAAVRAPGAAVAAAGAADRRERPGTGAIRDHPRSRRCRRLLIARLRTEGRVAEEAGSCRTSTPGETSPATDRATALRCEASLMSFRRL